MLSRVFHPLAALFFIFCFTYTSCKKLDHRKPDAIVSAADIRARFFSGVVPDARVAAIKQKIFRQEQVKPFVTDYVKWAGFPHWDKALVMEKASATTRIVGGNSSDYQIIYIPFTKDTTNNIGAILMAVVSPRDTFFKTIYRSQYQQLPYKTSSSTNATAEQMALFFMGFEHYAFGHSWFHITDTMLFHSDYPNTPYRRMQIDNLSMSRNMITFQVCGWVWIENNEGQLGNGDAPGNDSNLGHPEYQCDSMNPGGDDNYLFGDEGGGDGGFPGTSGSGSGGGSGGWADNPCRSIGAAGNGNPCDGGPNINPGWIPANDPYTFNPDQPFADLDFPIDAPDEPLLDNGIEITGPSANAGQGGAPRRIASTTNRNNTEDMTSGTAPIPDDIKSNFNGDAGLLTAMEDLFDDCTIFNPTMRSVGYDMIYHFIDHTGTPYENPTLNQEVKSTGTYKNWLKRFGDRLRTELRNQHGIIDNVGEILMGTDRMRFSNMYHKFHGLQICINDTEYTEVLLKNFTISPTGSYHADVTIIIHDHFGLDHHDAVTYQIYHSGFAAWWILQHHRGNRPFETVIRIEDGIDGQL